MAGEIKILIILIIGILFIKFALKKPLNQILFVLIIGTIFGATFQSILGEELNCYNGNINLYIGYVSVGIVIAWGIGLTAIYFISRFVIDTFGLRPGVVYYILIGIILTIGIEAVGYNIVKIQLVKQYPSLFPLFNCMHAPLVLYFYYLIVAVLFYFFITISHNKIVYLTGSR